MEEDEVPDRPDWTPNYKVVLAGVGMLAFSLFVLREGTKPKTDVTVPVTISCLVIAAGLLIPFLCGDP